MTWYAGLFGGEFRNTRVLVVGFRLTGAGLATLCAKTTNESTSQQETRPVLDLVVCEAIMGDSLAEVGKRMHFDSEASRLVVGKPRIHTEFTPR